MVPKLVKDTLAWVESKQGTAATALSVTGSIVQVGDKYRVFDSFLPAATFGAVRSSRAKVRWSVGRSVSPVCPAAHSFAYMHDILWIFGHLDSR